MSAAGAATRPTRRGPRGHAAGRRARPLGRHPRRGRRGGRARRGGVAAHRAATRVVRRHARPRRGHRVLPRRRPRARRAQDAEERRAHHERHVEGRVGRAVGLGRVARAQLAERHRQRRGGARRRRQGLPARLPLRPRDRRGRAPRPAARAPRALRDDARPARRVGRDRLPDGIHDAPPTARASTTPRSSPYGGFSPPQRCLAPRARSRATAACRPAPAARDGCGRACWPPRASRETRGAARGAPMCRGRSSSGV